MPEPLWSQMFHLGFPIAEKIARPVIIYVFLVVAVRLFGKRELAQLNPFDFVVLLTIANTVQNAIIGNDTTITGGIISALALFMINAVTVRFLYRHPKLDELVEGDPDALIVNGVIQKNRLEAELITVQELERAAHKQGFGSLADVERAVIEPGGGICFLGRQPPPDVSRHEELVKRLDQLSAQIAALRA